MLIFMEYVWFDSQHPYWRFYSQTLVKRPNSKLVKNNFAVQKTVHQCYPYLLQPGQGKERKSLKFRSQCSPTTSLEQLPNIDPIIGILEEDYYFPYRIHNWRLRHIKQQDSTV